MVRLEKAIFQSAANIKVLGRQRELGAPTKWYGEKRNEAFKVASYKLLNQGITGIIFKAVEPILAKFTWNWIKDIAHQRGFAAEDFLLFQDRELRRCFLFEHLMRSNFHPYQWVLFKRRRARYYKVERGVRGFYVPEWVRRDAEDRLLSETIQNREEWDDFVYREIMSDQTPGGHRTILNKHTLLDIIAMYGWFRYEAWDRLFYNEARYEGVTRAEVKEATNNPFGTHNFATTEGRSRFEADVNRFLNLYPGTVVRKGEQFDFNRFYAAEALVSGRDTSRFDGSLIENLKTQFKAAAKRPEDSKQKTKSVLGKDTPHFLRPAEGQSLF